MRACQGTAILIALSVVSGCQSVPELRDANSTVIGETPTSVLERLPPGFYDEAGGFARRAIENYLATSDMITAESGRGQDRMRAVVTPEWFAHEQEGFSHFRTTGERTLGSSILESSQVQLARRIPRGVLDIGVITCVDTTRVLVVGPEDEDPPAAVVEWLGERILPEAPPEEWDTIEGYFEASMARVGDRRAIVFWLVGESLDQLRIDHSEQWWGITLCQ